MSSRVQQEIIAANKACMDIMREHQRRVVRSEEEHLEIVEEALARYGLQRNNIAPGAIQHQRKQRFCRISSPVNLDSSFCYTPPLSPVSSGAPEPVPSGPSGSSPPAQTFSFGQLGVDFVFTPSASHAPSVAIKTMKIHLDGGAFEVLVDTREAKPTPKQKEFTAEEKEKQRKIVEEFRRNMSGLGH